jgi:tetratricopeptide (TPR) repeat protein
MSRITAMLSIFLLLPTAAPIFAQPPPATPASSDAKADPLLGKAVMPIAGARLRRLEKETSLRDVPAPFIVRKIDGNWLWVGRAWIKRSDVIPIEKAIEYYTAIIEKQPSEAWAYDFRGAVYHEIGDLEKALEDHTRAIELSPKDPTYLNNRGLVLLELGRPEEALADFESALKLDPKFAMAYCNRGALRIGTGDHQGALADYSAALKNDSDCAEAYNGLAWIQATSNDAQFRDGRKAVDNATKAARLTGYGDLAILDTLAAAHAEAGEWEEAIKQQKRAIELAGGNAEYVREAEQRLKLYQEKKPYRE